MAEKEKSTKTKADKSRIVMLFLFLIVLIIGIVFAFLGLKKHREAKQYSGAALQNVPSIESIPGSEAATQEYVKKQREENLLKAEQAAERAEKEQQSAAAIPTITRPVFKADSSEFLEGVKAGPSRIGCSPEEIKRARAAGVTASELRCKGCSVKDMHTLFTAAELRDAGFAAAELKADGFSAAELRQAGFSAKELLNTGLTANELQNAGYTVADLKTADVSLADLQKLGVDTTALRAAGFSAKEMQAAGFSIDALKKAGFSAKALKDAGVSVQALNDAGFSPTELMEAGATDAELAKVGILPDQIKALRTQLAAKENLPKDCSVGALTKAKNAGVSPAALAALKCDAAALKVAGYTAAQLKAAGFTAKDLKSAGFSPAQLKAGGYNAAELKAAAFTPKELKEAGFTASALKAAGISTQELKDAGYTGGDLLAAGATPAELRQAGYSAAELIKTGVTPTQLRTAGYTADQIKAANINPAELKKAGFTDGELIRAGFTTEEIMPPPPKAEVITPPPTSEKIASAQAKVVAAPISPTTPITTPQQKKSLSEIESVAPANEGMSDTEKVLARLQARQATQLSGDQKNELMQQIQTSMTAQVNELFASWNPPPTQVAVVHEEDKNAAAKAAAEGKGTSAGGQGAGAVETGNIFKAGTVMFAVLDTGINSDEVSPILATIVQGPLKGAKLLGQFSRTNKKVVLSFSTMSLPDYPSSFAVNAVAIDPNTARTAVAGSVNSHYLLRYGSLFASSFLSGYAQAVAQSGSTTTINPLGGSTIVTSPLSGHDKVAIALGAVGTQYSAEMGKSFSTPPTVKVDSGAGLGILFMADLKVPTNTGSQ